MGCIIEAQPSKYPSEEEILVSAASQSGLYTSSGKNSFLLPPGRESSDNSPQTSTQTKKTFTRGTSRIRSYKYSTTPTFTTTFSTTTSPPSTTTTFATIDDTCSAKSDGYYPNWASSCTSYYFCAAGYQLTYICPPGQRFNGQMCDSDYTCPSRRGVANPCGNRSNGYYAYPDGSHEGKYFYCFQKAKVIELQCEMGKVFKAGKCSATEYSRLEEVTGEKVTIISLDKDSGKRVNMSPYKIFQQSQLSPATKSKPDKKPLKELDTCSQKSNGFYTEPHSSCTKYYFCINGVKTGLSCQPGKVFNGDLCVVPSRFQCEEEQTPSFDHEAE